MQYNFVNHTRKPKQSNSQKQRRGWQLPEHAGEEEHKGQSKQTEFQQCKIHKPQRSTFSPLNMFKLQDVVNLLENILLRFASKLSQTSLREPLAQSRAQQTFFVKDHIVNGQTLWVTCKGGGDQKNLGLIYKKLCIQSYMFKLQSPLRYSLFDTTYLSGYFFHCSKRFLNMSILMPFSASAIFVLDLCTSAKPYPLKNFSYGETKVAWSETG